jgi:GNAT superfamily N-acetyltransferase
MGGQPGDLRLRAELIPGDEDAVEEIVRSSELFSEAEIDLAIDLVSERRRRGESSAHRFLLAERKQPERRTVGFLCYGEIPGTVGSYQIHWIQAHHDERGTGLRGWLLESCERRIAEGGGRRVYVESSERDQFRPMREFYSSHGYRIEARLDDFYAPGDAKLIFLKSLA